MHISAWGGTITKLLVPDANGVKAGTPRPPSLRPTDSWAPLGKTCSLSRKGYGQCRHVRSPEQALCAAY